MRLISSQLALRECLALSAAAELTLSGLARAVEATPSAAQSALRILLEDKVVEQVQATRRGYRLRSTETAAHVVGLAISEVPIGRAIATGARANPAIEFAALKGASLIVVFSAGSTALEQARAARYVEDVARRHDMPVEYHDHDEVRRGLLAAPQIRGRMARADLLHGDLDFSFPDRRRHGVQRGHALHRPHHSVRLPSRHALRALARRHRVDSLRLFGSSVRTDFRPDSDVDLLLRYRSGVLPSLRSLIELERALEARFGRDVDLLREDSLRPELREAVEREAVRLI